MRLLLLLIAVLLTGCSIRTWHYGTDPIAVSLDGRYYDADCSRGPCVYREVVKRDGEWHWKEQ